MIMIMFMVNADETSFDKHPTCREDYWVGRGKSNVLTVEDGTTRKLAKAQCELLI